jgi:hypothetical protein
MAPREKGPFGRSGEMKRCTEGAKPTLFGNILMLDAEAAVGLDISRETSAGA